MSRRVKGQRVENRKPKVRRHWTPELLAVAYTEHQAGESLTRICARANVTLASLSIALKNAGLEIMRHTPHNSTFAALPVHACIAYDNCGKRECVICDAPMPKEAE